MNNDSFACLAIRHCFQVMLIKFIKEILLNAVTWIKHYQQDLPVINTVFLYAFLLIYLLIFLLIFYWFFYHHFVKMKIVIQSQIKVMNCEISKEDPRKKSSETFVRMNSSSFIWFKR